ncbi:hypothetical protein BJ122_1369 [Rhodopseudomonas faecalis]|uniref:Uncharacterized protein n=1 Tax=Rhodopseudomonas faecalis TaxID=99655 RepID=A0A318T6T6_9BRAD|nr:hypothetical protein BJ122_1369 [Rhodopseudomonas faecalis]
MRQRFMYQNMQLSLTIVDPDTVMRIFPGVDDMQMSFARDLSHPHSPN